MWDPKKISLGSNTRNPTYGEAASNAAGDGRV